MPANRVPSIGYQVELVPLSTVCVCCALGLCVFNEKCALSQFVANKLTTTTTL